MQVALSGDLSSTLLPTTFLKRVALPLTAIAHICSIFSFYLQISSLLFINYITPSCRNYDLIFKKNFLLAKYAKTGKVNVFWLFKFDWKRWGGFCFLYRIRYNRHLVSNV